MRRRLTLVLLLVSVFWQSLAIGGYAVAFVDAEESEHAMLHWQEAPHHHHDDGAVAQDDSDASVQHVVADGCVGGAAFLPAIEFAFVPPDVGRPVAANEPAHPWPYLDGLRRPPRLTT